MKDKKIRSLWLSSQSWRDLKTKAAQLGFSGKGARERAVEIFLTSEFLLIPPGSKLKIEFQKSKKEVNSKNGKRK